MGKYQFFTNTRKENEDDEDEGIYRHTIKVFDDEEEKVIGTLIGYSCLDCTEQDIMDFDHINQDLSNLAFHFKEEVMDRDLFIIDKVFVDPKYRRQGMGKALVTAYLKDNLTTIGFAIASLPDRKKEEFSDPQDLIKFYKKLGFEIKNVGDSIYIWMESDEEPHEDPVEGLMARDIFNKMVKKQTEGYHD